jgi:predicted transcriptional regulator
MEKKEVPALPTTNNNVFVGSTTDLQRMLMKDVEAIEHEDE